MCSFLDTKRNYYHSFDTLIRSVWGGLVLVRNYLKALADDEEDQDEQENMDYVHLLKENKKKLLTFL
jgi:hypothetical protein